MGTANVVNGVCDNNNNNTRIKLYITCFIEQYIAFNSNG